MASKKAVDISQMTDADWQRLNEAVDRYWQERQRKEDEQLAEQRVWPVGLWNPKNVRLTDMIN